jgi:SRSO17 transposase
METGKKNQFNDIAQRFIDFHHRYRGHFDSKTRSVFASASNYLKGLMQAIRKNMERMEEYVIGADDQALQYMLTESQWDSKAVMDQVAQEANQLLGGDESCLLLDESGFEKKGEHSVGVARQWNGRLGKVDNCQVGVFAALGRGTRATLIDYRLYLPEKWCEEASRCKKAGIPEAFHLFKTKSELALDMVRHQRQQGIQFAWVGADGGYGKEPAFLRGLDDMDEIFVVDVHKDQLIYLDDPQPVIPPRKNNQRGRKTSRYQAQTLPVRVDNWKEAQPEEAWQRYKLRDSTKGELIVEILHQRVWVWDKNETHTHQWHLIVRRELNSQETCKYTLSNAPAETSAHQLAQMQGQRFWIERAFEDGKSESGMADYQARKWPSWQHHMALVSMAMLFMVEERERHQEETPLLSCNDIETLLRTFLPRRDVDPDEVVRQMEKRHRRRQASIDNAFNKQLAFSTG